MTILVYFKKIPTMQTTILVWVEDWEIFDAIMSKIDKRLREICDRIMSKIDKRLREIFVRIMSKMDKRLREIFVRIISNLRLCSIFG